MSSLPALEGGSPVREQFLPFGSPSITELEIDEVVDTLRSGWIGTGPKCKRFEEEFAEYVGAAHAVAVNSCTSALHLSLLAVGCGAGPNFAVGRYVRPLRSSRAMVRANGSVFTVCRVG